MATAVETYLLKSEIAFFQSSLRSPTLSNVDELCWSGIPENHSQVKKEEENFALPCLRPPQKVKLHISPRSRAVKTTKCTKKYDAGENCFFFCSLRPRPHVFGENGHRKRIFSKTPASRLRVDGRK